MPRPAAASPGEFKLVHVAPAGMVHSPPVPTGGPDVVLDNGSTVGGGKVPVPSLVFGRVAAQY